MNGWKALILLMGIGANHFVQAEAIETNSAILALESQVKQGDTKAQRALAAKYEHAEGVTQDYTKAIELYCQAAKKGDSDAQFDLGWMYANGRGVSRDDGIAVAFFTMAAAKGHQFAERTLQNIKQPPSKELPKCFTDSDKKEVVAVEENSELNLNLTSPQRKKIADLVYKLAPQYSIDPHFALAVISVESAFQANAQSAQNAQGLMQLIPATAKRFRVKNAFDPADNIKGGLAYMQWLLAFFKGNVSLVAAAYNSGEGAVEKYRGIPPYSETKNYVEKIRKIYKKTIHPYSSDIVDASLKMEPRARQTSNP